MVYVRAHRVHPADDFVARNPWVRDLDAPVIPLANAFVAPTHATGFDRYPDLLSHRVGNGLLDEFALRPGLRDHSRPHHASLI